MQKTPLFTRTGGEGIAANPAVVKAAFSNAVLTEGNTSDPIELGPNHIVLIRVDQHEKSVPKPLDEVRDQIRKRLGDQQLAQAGARAGRRVVSRVCRRARRSSRSPTPLKAAR